MQHDDDVRAGVEREAVARLLVAAVTGVSFVHMDPHARQRRRHRHRVVPAAVVHQNDFIHDALLVDFIHGFGDGLRRVVSGHHHDDFLFEKHGLL